MAQAESHAAYSEEWIVLVGKGEIRHDLIAADVESANDQWQAIERCRHRAVGGKLLFFGGRGFAFEKKKLSSEQTHTLGAGLNCARGFGGFADVRDDLDAV